MGWCENCENGSGWSRSRRSGEWDDWAGNACNLSCGCCSGPTLDDVVISDNGGENNSDENSDDGGNDGGNDGPNQEEVDPSMPPEETAEPEHFCEDAEPDDNTSFFRAYKKYECSQLQRFCGRNADIQERCPTSCCYFDATEVQLAEQFVGELSAGLITLVNRKRHSDTYVALLESEI